ncbi:MAG: site-specific DNA-methyltransferase, partial [Deltaproteobacteria bacterium]|nr:site-specific DNA-methyltransferase [Deltaproteobacteria bacterium]
IEGDNLEVMKLLYKAYFGRVKMIYIDPPYNTGNDFIYPDDFTDPLDTYLKLTGQKDSVGNLLTSNPETSGRYHSAWLSMMYPRLFLARQLLREDGVVFVSIDDIELANLRMAMNEIFGEENFISCIVWKKSYGGGAKVKHVVGLHEYVICYARSKDTISPIELRPDPGTRKYYKEKDEKFQIRGPYRLQPLATTSMDDRPNLRFPIIWQGQEVWPDKQWQWSKERVEQAIAENELVFTKQKDKWVVNYKQYLLDEEGKERGAKPFSILEGPYTQRGTSEIQELFGDGKVFPFPKPVPLIKSLMEYIWRDTTAVVLDFLAGSCPTAQAVLELNQEDGGNRKFIMVQLPEPTHNSDFPTIADIGKERIRRVIAKLKQENEGKLDLKTRETSEDLGFRVFKLSESHYKPWATSEKDKDPEAYARQMELHLDPLIPGWKPDSLIWEVAIKEGYGLNSLVEPLRQLAGNSFYRVTDPDKDQSFLICLDSSLKPEAVRALGLSRENLFICRDV